MDFLFSSFKICVGETKNRRGEKKFLLLKKVWTSATFCGIVVC